jgi:hypothetical protein
MLYNPSVPVLTVLTAPVDASRNVICTPGITAPDGPVTLPVTVPPVSCAWITPGSAKAKTTQSETATKILMVGCTSDSLVLLTDNEHDEGIG